MYCPFDISDVIAALTALNEADIEKDGAITVFKYLIDFGTKSVKFTSAAIEKLAPFDKVYLKQSAPLFSHFGLSCEQQEKPEVLLKAALFLLSQRPLILGTAAYLILCDVVNHDNKNADTSGTFEVVFETKFWETLKL
jgi:hypothetical protein